MKAFLSYIPAQSPLHAADARVKLIVVLVLSIVLFCVNSWWAVGAGALLMAATIVASCVPVKNYLRVLQPACAILAIIWVCNSFSFEGGFHFDGEASLNSLAYVLRITLVIIASFIITFTTTSTQLTDALASLMRPLRIVHLPVDDIAFTLSLALRFIPLLFEELESIKAAQMARGAQFGVGSPLKRFTIWIPVLVPLFVGFFRRAETVAEAMDARCYGASQRTSLNKK